jgi:hypothetical protein
MMLIAKQIQNITKMLSIAGLYSAFFAVQLFFNFDLSINQRINFADQLVHSSSGINKQHTQTQKSVSVKKNIRLNKRFHPSAVEINNEPFTSIISSFYTKIDLGHSTNQNLLNSISLSTPFRGPPAIA